MLCFGYLRETGIMKRITSIVLALATTLATMAVVPGAALAYHGWGGYGGGHGCGHGYGHGYGWGRPGWGSSPGWGGYGGGYGGGGCGGYPYWRHHHHHYHG